MKFVVRVSDLLQGALHCEQLTNYALDALARPSCADEATQVIEHIWSLGLPAPVAPDSMVSH